ncbi:hypothetical protein ACHAXS_004261 [Conticribra weissflogii]
MLSRNSFVTALAIAAMTISSAFADPLASDCVACESDFDVAYKIIGGPIQLFSFHDDQVNHRDQDDVSNVTKAHQQPPQVNEADLEVRFYATWSEGELCSSKSSSSFGAWEEPYASLEECCEMSFSWDYDNCILSR